jgi:hypothetical protein
MKYSVFKENKKNAIQQLNRLQQAWDTLFSIQEYRKYGPSANNAVLNLNLEKMPFDHLPYDEDLLNHGEIECYATFGKDPNGSYAKVKRHIENWIKFVKDINLTKNKTKEIPINFRTPPVTIKFMASCIGGGMKPRKLRSLMDSGHYSYIKIKHQNFIFDLRQFQPKVKEKLQK